MKQFNELENNIVKKQYKRYLDGHIKTIMVVEMLISKGFPSIKFEAFEQYMKAHNVEIKE